MFVFSSFKVLLILKNSFLVVKPSVLLSKKSMAKSKFEYVRQFEQESKCLENCWIIVRLDGRGFHKFTEIHEFEKPNDLRGLRLMTRAAVSVLQEFRDIVLAFGHSDEYSFVFKRSTDIYNRRSDKILSLVCSVFSSAYVFFWDQYFLNTKLVYPPSFDSRIILYPTNANMKDYLSWRQADVHVNNLYNTCFWSLVKKMGCTTTEAEERLKGTLASDKNELLFKEFQINYNNEPEMYRKGTTLIRKLIYLDEVKKKRQVIIPLNCDIIKEEFWNKNPELIQQCDLPTVDKDALDHYFFFQRTV